MADPSTSGASPAAAPTPAPETVLVGANVSRAGCVCDIELTHEGWADGSYGVAFCRYEGTAELATPGVPVIDDVSTGCELMAAAV